MRTSSIALPLLLLAGACVTPGDRAASGQCPTGEVCSPLTPRGLGFDGASFGDQLFGSGLYPTVIGGTQTLRIYDEATNAPLAHAFVARTNGTALAVDAELPAAVRLRGTASGTDLLRISDPSAHALFDRVQVRAAVVEDVGVTTPVFGEQVRPGRGLAVLRGGAATLIVWLVGQGERLVDESMIITPSSGRQTGWDDAQVTGAGSEVTLDLAFGAGERRTIAIPVADSVDDLVLIGGDPRANVGQATMACFAAASGAADVVGLTWRFRLSGPAIHHENALVPLGCVGFEPTAVGTVTITVEAGGLTRAFPIAITTQGARAAEPLPLDAGPTLGDRAAN